MILLLLASGIVSVIMGQIDDAISITVVGIFCQQKIAFLCGTF